MRGATAGANGRRGLAPQPLAGDEAKFLRGDATFAAQAINFIGGVAGASVPATATTKGDFYIITAAGTSQSKTWAIGDWAIYNGSSGSWTQQTTPAGFASNAETLAGALTSKAVTPASLAYAAPLQLAPEISKQRNALTSAQAVLFDGTRGATTSVAAFGSGDFTIVAWLTPTGVSSTQMLTAGTLAARFYIAGGTLRYQRADSAGNTDSGIAITALNPTMAHWRRASGTSYVGANDDAEYSAADAINYSGAIAKIGCEIDSTFNYSGALRMAIWTRALTADEIALVRRVGCARAVSTTGLVLDLDPNAPGSGLVWNDTSAAKSFLLLPFQGGCTWLVQSVTPNRIFATTAQSGNQQLLGGACLPPNAVIKAVYAKASTGTPSVYFGTYSGGANIVASVALSTSWKTLTNLLTDPTNSSAAELWANSSTSATISWCIEWAPVAL